MRNACLTTLGLKFRMYLGFNLCHVQVLDEGSQASEPEALVPLSKGVSQVIQQNKVIGANVLLNATDVTDAFPT